MKKMALLLVISFCCWTLQAQDIIFEELPIPFQEELLAEEAEADNNNIDEAEPYENYEKAYYSGASRTLATDTIYYFRWNPWDSAWMNDIRKLKMYNDDEQLVSVLVQHWRPVPGLWVNGIEKDFTYNASGRLDSALLKVYHHQTQNWCNFMLKVYSYNDTLLSSVSVKKWRHQSQEWINKKMLVRTYDDQGRLIADTSSVFRPFPNGQTNVWLNEYYYNELGYRDERISKRWAPDSAIWVNMSRAIFDVDSMGIYNLITFQFWHRFQQVWMDDKQVELYYNETGKISEKVFKHWCHQQQQWLYHFRKLFDYNEFGKVSEKLEQKWFPPLEDWKNWERNLFTYDGSGSLTERLTQHWRPGIEDWVNFRLMQIVIEYKSAMAGVPDPVSSENVRIICANPYSGYMPVSFEGLVPGTVYQFRMFGMNGEELISQSITSGNVIKLDPALRSGIYIMQISLNGRSIRAQKLLVGN